MCLQTPDLPENQRRIQRSPVEALAAHGLGSELSEDDQRDPVELRFRDGLGHVPEADVRR